MFLWISCIQRTHPDLQVRSHWQVLYYLFFSWSIQFLIAYFYFYTFPSVLFSFHVAASLFCIYFFLSSEVTDDEARSFLVKSEPKSEGGLKWISVLVVFSHVDTNHIRWWHNGSLLPSPNNHSLSSAIHNLELCKLGKICLIACF